MTQERRGFTTGRTVPAEIGNDCNCHLTAADFDKLSQKEVPLPLFKMLGNEPLLFCHYFECLSLFLWVP